MSTSGEHGLMSLLLLAHKPFTINDYVHTGIAPAADFIILSIGQFKEGEDKRLQKGVEWILDNKARYNIRIILCLQFNNYEPGGWVENTADKPRVKALRPAIEAGILVITPNGNTRFENELPPIEFLSVGGYIDRGVSDYSKHCPYPDEPYGRNGDGHLRPDLLAPRLYLPIPFCETGIQTQPVSYFFGTCASAVLTAGICANIWSVKPDISAEEMKSLLINTGAPIIGYENTAPRVNYSNAVNTALSGYFTNMLIYAPAVISQNPGKDVLSSDPVLRALGLTKLISLTKLSRNEIWKYVRQFSDDEKDCCMGAE